MHLLSFASQFSLSSKWSKRVFFKVQYDHLKKTTEAAFVNDQIVEGVRHRKNRID